MTKHEEYTWLLEQIRDLKRRYDAFKAGHSLTVTDEKQAIACQTLAKEGK